MTNKIDTEPLYDGEGVNAVPIGKSNKGFEYEVSLIKSLRNQGFTVSDPAGADSAKADLELTKGAKTIKFELKEKLSENSLTESFVAVRSSGLDEDSKEHSFAGQFSSYLFHYHSRRNSRKRCDYDH